MKMTIEANKLPEDFYVKRKFPDLKSYIYVFKKYFKNITKEDEEKLSFIFKNKKELDDIIFKLKNNDFDKLSLNFYLNFFRILEKDDFKIFFSLSEMNREHLYIMKKEVFIIEAFDDLNDNKVYFNYKKLLNSYIIEGEGYCFDYKDTSGINKMIKEIKERNQNKKIINDRYYGLNIDEWEKNFEKYKTESIDIIKQYLIKKNKNEKIKINFINLLNIEDINKINLEKDINKFLERNDIKTNFKNLILEIKNDNNKMNKIYDNVKKINTEFSLV